jgi:hypothetical protein
MFSIISSTFHTTQLGVRVFQQLFLELHALLDFKEIYRPRLRTTTNISSVNLNLMGAFTISLATCDQLFCAGIPVWLVRPYTVLPDLRIQSYVAHQSASDHIPLEAASRPEHPVIYQGHVDLILKYQALAQYILDYLRYPNPLGSIRSTSTVSPPTIEHSKHEINRQHYSPCMLF